jgi:hypothetical protein
MIRTDDPTIIILKLSTNEKSIITAKYDNTWIPAIVEVERVFDGIPVDLCVIRHDVRKNKNRYDCNSSILLKKDRSRVHTWIDHRSYSCTFNQLQKMLDGEIDEIRMFGFTGRFGKIIKLG